MFNLIIDNQYTLVSTKEMTLPEAMKSLIPQLVKFKFTDKYDPILHSRDLARSIYSDNKEKNIKADFKAVGRIVPGAEPVDTKLDPKNKTLKYSSTAGNLTLVDDSVLLDFNLYQKTLSLMSTGATIEMVNVPVTDLKSINVVLGKYFVAKKPDPKPAEKTIEATAEKTIETSEVPVVEKPVAKGRKTKAKAEESVVIKEKPAAAAESITIVSSKALVEPTASLEELLKAKGLFDGKSPIDAFNHTGSAS